MKKYLYVITNISMPDICKVGITDNVEQRLNNLNKTNIPTRFQIYQTFTSPFIKNPDILEQEIFKKFEKERVNRKREFIKIHPEKIVSFIEDYRDIDIEKDTSSKYSKIGLNAGDKVFFTYDGNEDKDIFATYDSGINFIFNGKKAALSNHALSIINSGNYLEDGKKWKSVQGTLYWSFKGRTIRDLLDEKNIIR